MLGLGILCACLGLMAAILQVRIVFMHRCAEEIRTELGERLEQDTNTLISVSSRDRYLRRLAADINAQLRTLRTERQKFRNGNRELREAVTNISHDLRTPLTAICGYLDLLKQEEKSEPAVRYLSVIENRTETMKGLTEELLRYSVIASAPEELVRETVSLGAVLEECVVAYYGALKGKGITPDISTPKAPVERLLDKSALSRIFGNILGNAMKYSDGDLSIVLKESGELVFSNTAAGLDRVITAQLFDRFYTVETGRGSTGLGLSIAKLLTEQMGGGIAAGYEQGRLAITLSFPKNPS